MVGVGEGELGVEEGFGGAVALGAEHLVIPVGKLKGPRGSGAGDVHVGRALQAVAAEFAVGPDRDGGFFEFVENAVFL